jgi:CRISPR/Cas system CSM-associated protein Csm3 (group 7 of RAMP superfamily)
MLKRLLNECLLSCEFTVQSRLLVQEPKEETSARPRSGDEAQVTSPDRTRLPDGRHTIYLPGSSLKGALRAGAERIARTLNQHGAGACNPFMRNAGDLHLACSDRLDAYTRRTDGPLAPDLIYREACPICRLFGYLGQGKRLRVTDFYPVTEPVVEQVTHIGVDRLTGGVAKGLTFTLAYVYQARLRGAIVIENYELWQLGLLGLLWRDLDEGLITVGHNQTTGCGILRTELQSLDLAVFGVRPADHQMPGVGALLAQTATEERALAYGYNPRERITCSPLAWKALPDRVGWGVTLDQAQAERCWRDLARQTAATLQEHQWSQRFAATGADRAAGGGA